MCVKVLWSFIKITHIIIIMGGVREKTLEKECCWQGLKGGEFSFFLFPIRVQTMDYSIVEFQGSFQLTTSPLLHVFTVYC